MFIPQEEKAGTGRSGELYVEGFSGGNDKHCPFIVEVCKDLKTGEGT